MDNIIQQVSSVSGIKYSEEQMKILKHIGGMCIVACAGSGKTSVLVSLLAKRIASGEIADTSKLLVTTYSVAGREELQVRINRLLEKMGIYSKVEIRTLHSAYYKLLKSLNMLGTIGTNGQRLLAIQKALKECEIRLEEEEVQTLDCLLSYQINNMFSDEMLYNDVNFTLDMSLADYTKVRKTFAAKKVELGFIDFDDLQLQLYVAMKNNESIRDYVSSVWDYFYIDEFQDVSKLQYEILKMMLKDPDKLVVIGDDDQCLVGDTVVSTFLGDKNIENITYMDNVTTCVGGGRTKHYGIDNISKKEYHGDIVKITTDSGRVVKGTANHIGFARIVPDENTYYVYLMYKRGFGYRIGTTSGVRAGNRHDIQNGINMRLMQEHADKLWILKVCDSKEESLYFEAYFAYNYGIPMYRFVANESGTAKTALSEESIIKLHKELNTIEKGEKLLKELGIDIQYPHRSPQADGERKKINFTMFGSSQVDKSGVHKSEISAHTSDVNYFDILMKYLAVTDRSTEGGYNYMNARSTTSNNELQESIIKNVLRDSKAAGLDVTADKFAKLNDNKYMFMPFGNMVNGMYVPVYDKDTETITEERIVYVETEQYDGYVYDLSVPGTRNYTANGMIVHNCIYEWRGADPNIILNICGTYDIERFVLSTNYRCGSEIVKKANIGIQNNSNRYVKQMEPFHEGGKINAVYSAGESYYDVSKKAFEKIRHLLLDGVSEEDISVLCRNNVHAVILNNMLLSEGIIHRASAEVKFHDNPMVKDLKACVEIGMNTHNFNIVSSHLWKLVQFFGAKNASIVANIMRDCSCNLLQAIKCFLIQFCGCFDYEFNDDVRLIQFNASRIYNVRPTHESIQSLKSLYNIIINSENDNATVKVIRVYLGNTIGFLYKSPDRERMIIGIADYFQDILQYGYEHYSKVMSKTSNLSEFEVEQHRKCINLSTMHGAKGKEWKHVILLGIDGNSCPAVHRMNELHGKGISDEDISTYVEQERRLHYVAMTRAKEELTLITDMNDVSPFFLEAMGLLSKEDSLNSHIIRWASNGGYRIGEIADYMEKLSDLISIYGFDKELGNAHIAGCENQDTTDFDEALDMMYDNAENGMDDALKAVNQFVKNCGEYAGIDINDMQE